MQITFEGGDAVANPKIMMVNQYFLINLTWISEVSKTQYSITDNLTID